MGQGIKNGGQKKELSWQDEKSAGHNGEALNFCISNGLETQFFRTKKHKNKQTKKVFVL